MLEESKEEEERNENFKLYLFDDEKIEDPVSDNDLPDENSIPFTY